MLWGLCRASKERAFLGGQTRWPVRAFPVRGVPVQLLALRPILGSILIANTMLRTSALTSGGQASTSGQRWVMWPHAVSPHQQCSQSLQRSVLLAITLQRGHS